VRLTRHHLYLLVGLVILIVGPAVFSQPNPSQWGGKDKMRMGGRDPDAFWNSISQGKETIDINNIQLPGRMAMMGDMFRERWKTFLESKGINDGIMTKALFDEYQEDARAKMQQAFGKGVFGKGGMGKGGGDASAPAVDPKAEDARIDAEAKMRFAMLDQNKDNFIDREEARFARGTLRDFDRWDANHDGKISLDEFIEAYRDEQAQYGRGSRAANNGAIIQPGEDVQEEDKRPVVYRAGKLPKELPPWFAEYDKDKDGQVGLYEWKAASGKSTSEFVEMDANGDGFLTVEEVLRHQKATGKDKQATPGINAVAGGPNGMPWGGMPGGGMMGAGRFGQAGWGQFMPGGGPRGRGGMPGMDRRRGVPGGVPGGVRGMREPGGGRSRRGGRGGVDQ
jgi:Ca2+-binding EF-hand superfamily protein